MQASLVVAVAALALCAAAVAPAVGAFRCPNT